MRFDRKKDSKQTGNERKFHGQGKWATPLSLAIAPFFKPVFVPGGKATL